MAKKNKRTRKDKSEISRIQQTAGATRKTASRKMRAAPKVKDEVKAQAATPAPKQQPMTTSEIGSARSEGIRLFKLAGRPTKEQFIQVYGERGPKMTWDQRAAVGVPAEKFQAALAEKAVSRPAAAKPARTTKQSPTLPLAGAYLLRHVSQLLPALRDEPD
jgi:hypothetical protein